MHSITLNEYNLLADKHKKQLLVDAYKITERIDGKKKYEIFQINDFFVEVISDFEYKISRRIKTYQYQDIPLLYASDITTNLTPKISKNSQSFTLEYLY